MDWTSNRMIALYIAVGVVAAGVVAWGVLGKTVRSRLRMEKMLRNDPDINDWLIVFNWTSKILYLPTIAVSVLACLLMFLKQGGWFFEAVTPGMIGGAWLVVFFVNFLVEEFEISVKLLLITIVSPNNNARLNMTIFLIILSPFPLRLLSFRKCIFFFSFHRKF